MHLVQRMDWGAGCLYLFKLRMEKTIESINSVLADWNPIGLDLEIANEEYKSYIPDILRFVGNKNQLFHYLEDILINKMELGYDPMNRAHSEDLEQVCGKIIEAYQISKLSI